MGSSRRKSLQCSVFRCSHTPATSVTKESFSFDFGRMRAIGELICWGL